MRALFRKTPPALQALLLQSVAFLLTLTLTQRLEREPGILEFALCCGFAAATLSHLAGLARWWLFIQLLFVPALVVTRALHIPSGYFLAAFIVLILVYWSAFRTQVPLYLSSKKVWLALEKLLPAPQSPQPLRFIDLGCGLGGVQTYLARARPDGRYDGVEYAPLPCLWAWLRIKWGGQKNCTVHWGSLWNCNLSQYDVVFAYLSPVPMEQLWHKARSEMRPGSLFISSTFNVPEQIPHERVAVNDLHHATLLVWRM